MRVLAFIFVFFMSAVSFAESLPSQAGLDAAQAVAAMHDAVMADVLESDISFSDMAGADSLFVLYADAESRNFLMVSLGETGDKADIAVIQSYALADFDKCALKSLTALALPFIPDEHYAAFEDWRDATAAAVAEAAQKGADMELTYYTGEYIACAMSVFHDEVGPMFTALVSWNEPLSAEDITARMDGMAQTEEIEDGQADDK